MVQLDNELYSDFALHNELLRHPIDYTTQGLTESDLKRESFSRLTMWRRFTKYDLTHGVFHRLGLKQGPSHSQSIEDIKLFHFVNFFKPINHQPETSIQTDFDMIYQAISLCYQVQMARQNKNLNFYVLPPPSWMYDELVQELY